MYTSYEASANGPASWLFFGLSGAVGRAVQCQRELQDPPWLAISRHADRSMAGGIEWRLGCLPNAVPDPQGFPPLAGIASLGPLDAFAHWFAASDCCPPRVIALGSTSIASKRDSGDPVERALAARLAEAESLLTRACQERGVPLLLLRPTLIYGMGGDRSLSTLVALAKRWRWLPITVRATGLRMPVHAADLAALVLAALRRETPWAGCYATPGGEALTFRAMLDRTLAAAAPESRLLPVPDVAFRTGFRVAQGLGLIAGASAGMLSRLDQNLCADLAPAQRDLNYRPRPFLPRADMFTGVVSLTADK